MTPLIHHTSTHVYLLLKEILRSFAVVTKKRKQVSGHVELKLSCPAITEMIRQDHLTERHMNILSLFHCNCTARKPHGPAVNFQTTEQIDQLHMCFFPLPLHLFGMLVSQLCTKEVWMHRGGMPLAIQTH